MKPKVITNHDLAMKLASEYAQEHKRLVKLHDSAPESKRNEIFDRMTRVLNLFHKARDPKFKAIRVRFSGKRVG